MKKNRYLLLVLIGILAVGIGCNNSSEQESQQPVAKVFGEYLYYEDIAYIVPQEESEEDSAILIQTYINNWIQDKIMLHYANDYLKNQKDEIEKKTEEFKNSLLIHQFKKELIAANSDSTLDSDEIEAYYNAHYQEFKLSYSIIRGFLIKIPEDSDGIDSFKDLLYSNYDRDIDEIIIYINTVNGSFEDFTKNWVDFPTAIMKVPVAVDNSNNFCKTHKYVEATENGVYYFLFISNFVTKGKIAPLEYAQDNIMKILQKEQSNAILDKFKKDKYAEALKSGDIEFF
ncbi:MAG: hypothetical protein U9Q83_11560 [Bacteroidota bacterium]|nr:hypothetical protein [Bacteroidota bacterium]